MKKNIVKKFLVLKSGSSHLTRSLRSKFPDLNSLSGNLGFSLIEMLIVVTLTVLIIVAASSVLLTALLSGGEVNTTKTIKQNGDYAIGEMTTRLRNAIKLLPNDFGQTCVAGMSQLRFLSLDEGVTTLQRVVVTGTDARIASNSAVYLTSDAVYLPDTLQFNCKQSLDGSVTNIAISFTLTRGNQSSGRITEVGTQDFTSNVTLRSF